jgi:hypothetical protein
MNVSKAIVAFSSATIGSMATIVLLMLVVPATAHATGTPQTSSTKTAQTTTTNKTAPKNPYSYVAQPRDSYSKMARKAVQTYGIRNNVTLTTGRILYAETMLTQQAGSPELQQGQTITFNESTVKSWVDKAKALSNTSAAKWDRYTVNVNFNTDHVGEA